MSGIKDYFLRAKHWQIFGLLIGAQLAGFVGSVAAVVLLSQAVGEIVGTTIPILFSLCLLAWWWSIGLLLHSQIPAHRELNLTLFRFSLIWLILCPLMLQIFPLTQNPILMTVGGLAAISLLSSCFYILLFLSKSLTVRNKGREALGGGDVTYFFLFLFFFVGVWFIQPRINQLYAEMKNSA